MYMRTDNFQDEAVVKSISTWYCDHCTESSPVTDSHGRSRGAVAEPCEGTCIIVLP